MKTKYFIILTALIIFGFVGPSSSFAHGMMGDLTLKKDNHTAQEEAEGKALWQKIEAKEITCQSLTADNFAALGEYFMGQMAGTVHETMNNMMAQMMGAQSEEQIHVAIGKRMSGCEPNAPLPQGMMNMMNGAGMMGSFGPGMMGYAWGSTWSSWGIACWITLILLWILMASASAYLIKRVNKK